MRVADLPYFEGLTPTERQQLIFQAAAEQQKEINGLFNQLFKETAAAVDEATRPLTYWSNIARDNRRSPYPSPVDYWENQGVQRRSRDQANFQFGITPPPAAMPLRPGFGTALSPVEFARGQKHSPGIQPRIGLPPPMAIRTLRFDEIYTVRSEVTSPTGRIVDVFA
jgi:hypothetical protein